MTNAVTKVEAVNFLSWKELKFDFKPGVTLMDGWNEDDQTSEGSGKSAVPNAIAWGLYGKIPKDANVDDVIKQGEKNCAVVVHFADGSAVARARNPNSLTLVRNGVQVRGKDAKETQALVEEFVGLSFDTFCQTTYFAQNYAKKFLTSNQEEKGKILSEIQNLEVFDKAGKEVKSLLKLEEETLIQLNHSVQLLNRDLDLVKRDVAAEEMVLNNLQARREQQIAQMTERAEDAAKQVVDAQRNYEAVRERLNALSYDEAEEGKLRDELGTLNYEMAVIRTDISAVDSAASKKMAAEVQAKRYATRYQQLQVDKQRNLAFISNPVKTCPTCGATSENCDTSHAVREIERVDQELTSISDTLEILAKEINASVPTKEELNASMRDKRSTLVDLESRLKEITQVKAKLAEGETTLKFFRQTCVDAKASYSSMMQAIEAARAEPLNLDASKLESLKLKLSEVQERIAHSETIKLEKHTHARRLEALRDGFKEVKLHVFNAVLRDVNYRVKAYLAKLFEVPVSVKFVNRDMKIETEVTYDGCERGLGLLSGGQLRRVSLAVDLALHDVVAARKGSKIGLLILDEYFKDLSEQSMEKCLTLLEERTQPVVLIEHNSLFKSIVNNSVLVRLEDGTSSIEA